MDVNPSSIEFFPEHCITPKTGHTNSEGRIELRFYRDRNVAAHRLSFKLFIGDLPEKMYVVQTCGNLSCINPKHLKLEKLTCGIKHHSAKLNPDIVRAIRKSNLTDTALAAMYGVSRQCVSNTRSGKTWKEVDGVEESSNV